MCPGVGGLSESVGRGEFQDYLLRHKFTVLTDHSSLQSLMKQDVPKDWDYKLRLFDFAIILRQTRPDRLRHQLLPRCLPSCGLASRLLRSSHDVIEW